MSKKTLGQLTKQLLSDMDMDVVNNINETEEALQVARIVVSCYEELVTRFSLPVEKKLFQLEATTDTTPTLMTIPSDITYVESIAYDMKNNYSDPIRYVEVSHLEPEDFMRLSNGRLDSLTDVTEIVLPSGVSLFIRNNVHPTYWTSFDNETIVFDAFRSDLETNLQNSKTQCYGVSEVVVPLEEDAEIKLDPQLFSLLENKARATAFVRLKQTRDPSSEASARQLEIKAQDIKWRQNGGFKYPGYGRWVR